MWIWLIVAFVVFVGATWVVNHKRIKKEAAEEAKAPAIPPPVVEQKIEVTTPIVQDYSKPAASLANGAAPSAPKKAKKRKPKKPTKK